MADSDGIAKLVDLTEDIKITMFTTIDAEGHFVSRPMAQHLVEPDGDLWFFAERNSHLVEQITANPHVGLTLSSNDTWISIDGAAEVVEDQEEGQVLVEQLGGSLAAGRSGRPERRLDQGRPAHR